MAGTSKSTPSRRPPRSLLAAPRSSLSTVAAARRKLVVAGIVLGCGLAVAWGLFAERGTGGSAAEAGSALTLNDIPFNGARAYDYLKELCAIGPRCSGSPGMEKQQKLLAEHFRKFGGQVEFQRFRVRHPQDGSLVPMANIIVRWNPASPIASSSAPIMTLCRSRWRTR